LRIRLAVKVLQKISYFQNKGRRYQVYHFKDILPERRWGSFVWIIKNNTYMATENMVTEKTSNEGIGILMVFMPAWR
jgi:hypothetical protein